MTKVYFLTNGNTIKGFSISGHSSVNCEDSEGKIVCSAVSSAVYMTANTITEIIGDTCDIKLDDAVFELQLKQESNASQTVLKGLQLHLNELSQQYPKRIKIITEV